MIRTIIITGMLAGVCLLLAGCRTTRPQATPRGRADGGSGGNWRRP